MRWPLHANLQNYVKSTMEESGWQVVRGRRRGRRWEQELGAGVRGANSQDKIPLTYAAPSKLVFRGAGTKYARITRC